MTAPPDKEETARPSRGMRRWRVASWAAAAIAAAALLARGLTGEGRDTAPLVGRTAPNFEVSALDGGQVTLRDMAGKAVVLNFWASWCAPCRTEMPYFERVSRAYGDRGVVFVGAAVEDDVASARAFATQLGISYPLGLDDGSAAAGYQVAGLPSTMFIGRDGKLVRRWAGVLDERQLIDFVEEIAR